MSHFNIAALPPAELLSEIMKRIYKQGMTTTSGGNLSIKDEEGNVYITPGGTDKGVMGAEDIVCIHPDGSMSGKHKPSSEYPFHLKIYETRSDIRAVLHAHPPAMVSYSIVRQLPDIAMFPDMKRKIGDIGMAPYALTGSDTLGEKIAKVFRAGYSVAELENHGLVVGAENLFLAYQKFEAVDFCARIGVSASLLKNKQAQGSVPETWQESWLCEAQAPPAVQSPQELAEKVQKEQAEKLLSMIRRAYDKKLLYGGMGIFSVRAGGSGKILYLPEGTDCENATTKELCLFDVTDGTLRGWLLLHQEIYRQHPDIKAILSAFPPELMAFAVSGREFNSRTIPEIYMVMQDVATVPEQTAKSDWKKVAAVFDSRTSVAILEKTGVVVTAPSLLKAYDRLEVAEYSAKAVIMGKQLGSIVEISEHQLEEIRNQCHLN